MSKHNSFNQESYLDRIIPFLPTGFGKNPVVLLSVSEDTLPDFLVSASGSKLSQPGGALISASTTSSEAILTYELSIAGTVIYRASIAPDGDPSDISDWTYISGARDATQFENELVDNVTGGSGFEFTFDKLEWARTSGDIDDCVNGQAAVQLDWQLQLDDVVSGFSAVSSLDFAGINRVEALMQTPVAIDNDGVTIFYSEFVNHAFRRIDPNPGWGNDYRLCTISGSPPNLPTSGNNPTFPGTDTGSDARHNSPESVSLAKSLAKVNGYYIVYAIDRVNKSLYTISHNGGSNTNELLNWNVTAEDFSTTIGFPKLYVDPDRVQNGKAVFFMGVSLDLIYWDGAAWTTVVLSTQPTSGIIGVDFQANGDIVVAYYTGSVYRITIWEQTGAGYLTAGDWAIKHEVESTTSHFGVFTYGTSNGEPVIYAIASAGNGIDRYEYNGGVSGTTADWDKTNVITFSKTYSPLYATVMNDEVYVTCATTKEIIAVDLATFTERPFKGVSGTAGYENDLDY